MNLYYFLNFFKKFYNFFYFQININEYILIYLFFLKKINFLQFLILENEFSDFLKLI